MEAMGEEGLSVEEVSELTGLEPERVRAYIRLGRLRARLVGSAFAEDYRVERSELERDPEIRALLRERAAGKASSSGEEARKGADLVGLVDRYRAMLDEIARYKLRAASLGGSPAARGVRSDLEKRTREAEELEREINALRAKIMAKEDQIRRLGPPRERGDDS
mgnify:CR=1 FL=1